jgi:hypothetical protein
MIRITRCETTTFETPSNLESLFADPFLLATPCWMRRRTVRACPSSLHKPILELLTTGPLSRAEIIKALPELLAANGFTLPLPPNDKSTVKKALNGLKCAGKVENVRIGWWRKTGSLLILCGLGIALGACGGALPEAKAQSPTSNNGTVSVTVGSTLTGAPGTQARVTNAGNSQNVVLDFLIPAGVQGLMGLPGSNATIQVGQVSELPPSAKPSVTNSGSEVNAILNFALPQGMAGQGIPGQQGPKGDAATIAVGTVTSLPANSQPSVVNVGNSQNAILDFGFPAPSAAPSPPKPLFGMVQPVEVCLNTAGGVCAGNLGGDGIATVMLLPNPLQATCPASSCTLDVRISVMAAILSDDTVGSFDLAMDGNNPSNGPVVFGQTGSQYVSCTEGMTCGPFYANFNWSWFVIWQGPANTPFGVNVALSCQPTSASQDGACTSGIGGVGESWSSIGVIRVDVFPN